MQGNGLETAEDGVLGYPEDSTARSKGLDAPGTQRMEVSSEGIELEDDEEEVIRVTSARATLTPRPSALLS